MTTRSPAQVEQSTISKISWRLVPFLGLMFFINFLDRTAISFAGPNGMNKDLGLTAAQFGFAAGIFFLGYIILEIPSNLALHKYGARRWLSRIMVSWGVISMLFAWVSNIDGLYILRFLLGIAEAGFFPGAILYLALWVPGRHRSRILSVFYIAQPLTVVIGAPVAALLLQSDGLLGLAGWRIMFFGVAVPAILIGIIAWYCLPDRPADARWLTSEEKDWLNRAFATERNANSHAHTQGALEALKNGRVWLLSLVYFGLVYGLYALAFFLPTIIGGFETQFGAKFNIFERGLITAIPYLPAAFALYFWSRDATSRGVRTWHIALPALIGALSIPAALFMSSPVATVAVITVTACAIFSALPSFWAIPSRFLTGAGAAAGIGLINSAGNIAGFTAPYVTGAVKDATGSYNAPMFVVGAVMLLSAVIVTALGRRVDVMKPSPALNEQTV